MPQTISCLRTLANNPALAGHTLSYEVGDMDSLDFDRTKRLFSSFYRLLARALQNMIRLTALTYLMYGSVSHALVGAPFRLTKLTVSCDFDSGFATFLTQQRTLRTALFCGRYIPDTTLDYSALPELNRVSASPLILATVVPGRPVREVELCLVHPWLLNEDMVATTMQILSYSRGPLQSLQIISHLTGTTESILGALGAIPTGLAALDSFALHAVSGSITNDLLLGFPPILARFTALKSLVLVSKNKYDAVHDHVLTKSLAASWHAKCASLECVSLPNATWVRNRRHGWVTLHELERLLHEREQALLNREKNVQKREASLDLEQRSLEERERQLEVQIRELRQELGEGVVELM
ncbi:hypothetical protein EWM64_g3028 [Hericium alpestre]|uniref:Uncharacterized protein n=1 Tax=Hericium alpestre TaxID=135208 RepID=A0A4Z0A3S5_9AGAM|nr:hypothetical protein EWM64_g3028 [Hericium alpestre]